MFYCRRLYEQACYNALYLSSAEEKDMLRVVKSTNESDHAFLTISRTNLTKLQVRVMLATLNMKRYVLVTEPHAVPKPPVHPGDDMEETVDDTDEEFIDDDPDSSADDELDTMYKAAFPSHIHVALSGLINRKKFANSVRELVKPLHLASPQVPLSVMQLAAISVRHPTAHVDVAFAHPPVKGAKGRGKAWGFGDMCEYIICSKKDKILDAEPFVFGAEDYEALINLHDEEFGTDNKAIMARIRELAVPGVPESELHAYLLDTLPTHEFMKYRAYVSYYHGLPPVFCRSTKPEDNPSAFQQVVIGWAMSPLACDETNNTIMWLRTRTGSGKTWIINRCEDLLQGAVYTPTWRAHGRLDMSSMMDYAGESLIVFDDVEPDRRTRDWDPALLFMMKQITSGKSCSFRFGSTYKKLKVRARVLVTSNFPRPKGISTEDEAALKRRFLCIHRMADINTRLAAQLAVVHDAHMEVEDNPDEDD